MGIFENMTEYLAYAWMFLAVTALSALLTRRFIAVAINRRWTVEPNERSCHSDVKPIGGGVAVISITLAAWLIFGAPIDPVGLAVLAGAIGLGIISWIDDLITVRPALRLSLQIAAVAVVLMLLPAEQRILSDDWPLLIERVLTGFFWVWLINLYNFMDGIDGLAACETIAICLGLVIIGNIVGLPTDTLILAVALGGATLGFLPWNWHNSRIMLGDVGAIPIGYLIGFLLLNLAFKGYVVAALILPLYFLTDASLTLIRRIFRGENFLKPHKEHSYQKVVQSGDSHDHVVIKIIATNIVLICAAYLSMSEPLWAALVAVAAVIILMIQFHIRARA